jgi:hypothetical protein
MISIDFYDDFLGDIAYQYLALGYIEAELGAAPPCAFVYYYNSWSEPLYLNAVWWIPPVNAQIMATYFADHGGRPYPFNYPHTAYAQTDFMIHWTFQEWF